MDRFDPEVLWAVLLAEGVDELSGEEYLRLAAWLDAKPPEEWDALAPGSEALAGQVLGLAAALIGLDRMETAFTVFRLSLAGFERYAKPRSQDRLDALRTYATALLRADRLDEAEAAVERLAVLSKALKTGRDGWDSIILFHQAAIADRRGRQAEAPDLLRRALALSEREFGPLGGWSDIIRNALVNSLAFLRLDEELITLCRKAAILFDNDPEAVRPWLIRLVEHVSPHGGGRELETAQRRLVEISSALLGPQEQAEDLVGLGRILAESNKPDEALKPLAQAITLATSLKEEPGLLASARFWMAEALARTEDGDPEQIHELYRSAIAGFTEVAGSRDDATLYARNALGRFLQDMGLLEDAETEIAAICADAETEQSPLAPELAETLARLRRRRLATREKGRLFGWALNLGREAHGADRLSLILTGLRAVADQAESVADRYRLWAETAILLASVGHEDQSFTILATNLAGPEAGAERARVQAQLATERLKRGDTEAGRDAVAQACAQALETGGTALAEILHALAQGGGSEALALAETAIPLSARPRLRDAMIAERLRHGDLDRALALFEDWRGAALAVETIRDLGIQAAEAGRSDEAVALARRLADTALDQDAVGILLQVGAESEALAAVGALESGLPFITGVALAARYFGMKGERALFVRRAGEAFTHLGDHSMQTDAVAKPLRHLAEGALELMGKDQALVWAAGLLPDHLVAGFASAMGRALEEKRGIGSEGAALDQSLAQEQSKSLAALGRWDDAVIALASMTNPAAMVDSCIHVAAAAKAGGNSEAAARALKVAFGRLSGADAQCGRRLGEAVAESLPAEWRGAFADAALSRAAAMDDLHAATSYVVAAAHASMGAVDPED